MITQVDADPRLPGLLELTYDAALDRSKWQAVLNALSETFHGGSTIIAHDARNSSADFQATSNLSDAALKDYQAHYAPQNPWLARAKHRPAGTVIISQEVISDEELRSLEFYNDFLRPHGLHDGFSYYAEHDGERIASIAVLRDAGARTYEAADIALWRAFAPHAGRAMAIHRRVAAAELAGDTSFQAFDRLGLGVVALDERVRIIHANSIAERLLREGDALWAREGRLESWRTNVTERLERLIADAHRAARGHGGTAGGFLPLPRLGRPPLQGSVMPLLPQALALGLRRPAALLFLHDPVNQAPTPAALLRQLWGFSPAEARLVQALLMGKRIEEHAEASDITIGTAKTLLRRAFDRVGVRRQSELVRLVLSNPLTRLSGLTSNSPAVDRIPRRNARSKTT